MKFAIVAVIVACVMAGAALAVSLLHAGPAGPSGPAGPAGPRGNTGASATQSRLGICWDVTYQNNGTITWVSSVDVQPPIYANGVYTCAQGYTFTTIVPGSGH